MQGRKNKNKQEQHRATNTHNMRKPLLATFIRSLLAPVQHYKHGQITDAGLINSTKHVSCLTLCQELAQRGQDVADCFFSLSFFGGECGGEKSSDWSKRNIAACCLSEQNPGVLKRPANIHTSGAIECSVMRRGEQENGFPVLHELAAANMKLTAAM